MINWILAILIVVAVALFIVAAAFLINNWPVYALLVLGPLFVAWVVAVVKRKLDGG